MNKLYTTLLIACLAAGFTACNDDDCEDLHLGNLAHYPNVLKGTFPTESQVLELGETLEITPELLNPEGATYSWLVNGKEYSTEPTFSYKDDNGNYRYNQFDLDDAVDQNGNPVTLERIHFVKVQSAILKNVESIGEVSTEVVGFKAF